VDTLNAIRSNFFYPRTVPCELWFFGRDKKNFSSPPTGERARVRGKDTVLMLDARTVYCKVMRKIYDFSTEQEQNLLAIVWLYRDETDRYGASLRLSKTAPGNFVCPL
jgi:type I restriction enzyme M protein